VWLSEDTYDLIDDFVGALADRCGVSAHREFSVGSAEGGTIARLPKAILNCPAMSLL
jgi:hypothetical protein